MPTFDTLRTNLKAIDNLSLPADFSKDLAQWKADREKLELMAIQEADKLDRQRAQKVRSEAEKRLKAQMHLALTRAQQLPTWSNKKYNKPITNLNQLSKNDFQKMVAAGKEDFKRLPPEKQKTLMDFVSIGNSNKKQKARA